MATSPSANAGRIEVTTLLRRAETTDRHESNFYKLRHAFRADICILHIRYDPYRLPCLHALASVLQHTFYLLAICLEN